MTGRTREWLQSFLHLESRASALTVPARDIERQEDTVLRALSLLDEQPGVVLADEVGMGKTYEALGVVAARHQENRERRMLILTPGPDLNTKWTKELDAFCDRHLPMYVGFEGQYGAASTLQELVKIREQKRILVAPITMFQGARAREHNRYLLSLFFEWLGEHGNTRNAAFRRYRDGALTRTDVRAEKFLGEVDWADVERLLPDIFQGTKGRAASRMLQGWKEHGIELFARGEVDDALAELRFRLVGALLPDLDLLVVDEAHKLKNAGSLRALAVREVFDRRFEKALFLTATPFQLDVSELRQVLDLFQLARTAPPDLRKRADRLLDDVAEYKGAYLEFESAWRRLETDRDFAALFAADPTLASAKPEDPTVARVVERARRLLALKREKVEPGFRTWMIRSLREDKRVYREHKRKTLRPEGGAALPFLLYERFIAELFRSHSRTHKAAVQINMVSSYEAARTGALLAEELREGLGPDAEAYRALLRNVLEGLQSERNPHPKLSHVVDDALDAAERGDKTLVFCARVESLRELTRRIRAAWEDRIVRSWQRAFPDATHESILGLRDEEADRVRGLHESLRDRLHRTDSVLYLALRERYLGAAGIEEQALAQLPEVVEASNRLLRERRVRKSRAADFDWALAKRCVEAAAARLVEGTVGAVIEDRVVLQHLVDPAFVVHGFDGEPDDLEPDEVGDHAPSWVIDIEHATRILRPVHDLWSRQRTHLLDVPRGLRVRAVERLARYLTSRDVRFLSDLAHEASRAGIDVRRVDPGTLLDFMSVFWRGDVGARWSRLVSSFLEHLHHFEDERRHELIEALDTEKRLAFCRHTADGETRERLREAFNTPLFPMVLVANEVMQEGLDLHHQCARIVHHDLAWNPAQLEQRVGRIDRLGALIQRRRQKDAEARLEVLYPLIDRTIDVRLDRTVRAREKWSEFLLGAAPNLEEYNLADDPILELPQAFADALRVKLGPA